jgi:4-amino-4-deoxy-L-arabinose transferase-like glycosyltransferase
LRYADVLTAVRTSSAVLATLALVLYIGPLFLDTPLTDPDEGLHAGIVQEMRERGEFVVPRFLGEPFLDKPILYFWTQLASTAWLGMNAGAVRLPGLLFAILGVATTGWMAAALFGNRVGQMAAACYATLAVPFGLAQAPVHDVALVPFANVAILAFWRLAESRSPAYVALAGVALGLSILTKGLAAIAVAGLAIGLMLLFTRRLTARLAIYGLVALGLAALVAAPWYLAVESRQPGYLRYYFVSRHLLGFATDSQRHGGQSWWYYLPIIGAGGLPWILYLRWNLRTPAADRDANILLWSWLIGVVVMLSLAGSKLVTYALPAFPPIAILAARYWASALDGADGTARPGYRTRLHALVFAGAAAVLPWAAGRVGGASIGWIAWMVLAAASLGWLWIWHRIPRETPAWTWTTLSLGTGVTYALALMLLATTLAEAHSARDLAARLNQSPTLPPTVFIVGDRIGSVVFYLRPDLRQSLDSSRMQTVNAGDAAAAARSGDVIAVRAKDVWRLGEALAPWMPYRRDAGRYVVLGPRPENTGARPD